MQSRPIDVVIEEFIAEWTERPGIAGVYRAECGAGTPCIVVMVGAGAEGLRSALPRAVDGYPVLLEDASDLRPMRPPGAAD